MFWLPNIWMGVSVEAQDYVTASTTCVKPARTRSSLRGTLLGPLPDLDLTGIDWVIVGGESGPGARPMKPEWVTNPRPVPPGAGSFLLQAMGWDQKKRAGRELEGRTWDEMPRSKRKFSRTRTAVSVHTTSVSRGVPDHER